MSSGASAPVQGGSADAAKDLSSARNQRRVELHALNVAAWERGTPAEVSNKLDSSLKKHTALLNKLRTSINSTTTAPALLKEIQSLSLEKYIEEAVGASIEGLTKCKNASEIYAAIEVVSALHQRFPNVYGPDFGTQILTAVPYAPSTATDVEVREKEDAARVAKQRTLIRVLGEADIVGIVKGKGETTVTVLKEMLKSDKDNLAASAPVAIAFVKYLGPVFLPPNEDNQSAQDAQLVDRSVKEKAAQLLTAYYEGLGKREAREHLEMQKQDKRNHEAYIRSGEIFEDREKAYEKRLRAWERGWTSVTSLSELLKLPLPALPSLASASKDAAVVTSGTSGSAARDEFNAAGSVWLDEEEKHFYEDLRDLRREVPAGFLGIKAEATESQPAEQTKEAPDETPAPPSTNAESAEPKDDSIAAGPAAQLTSLLARLPEASSRNMIDQIAVDFAFLNSKAARKRLVKTLANVDRNRSDLLPYYARLVATLNPYMPDIAKELIGLLDDEFRSLQRRRPAELIESRTKNLRFVSELTKFGLVPEHTIFHMYKVLVDDMRDVNIDSLCILLENCGRYLLRTEATRERMRGVVEIVKRKKSATTLDGRQTVMLENAYYQCDPPERAAIPVKERTPIEMYIRHLFYRVLTRNARERVLKMVRKLDLDDAKVYRKLHNAFTKVWKVKFSNVHLFAVLLKELNRYHPEFVVSVIDDVLENVRLGMEVNNFKYNQQRVATVKYLGELFNYRLVDSGVIFNTLWSLVTFGHPDGRPRPEAPSPIDSPDDFFRIRLVCTILDTSGDKLDRGALKQPLDVFLTFFQMYCLSKNVLPMDVGFMLTDTFETLRPHVSLFQTYPEAALAVDELLAQNDANGVPSEAAAQPGPQETSLGHASGSSSESDDSDEDEDSSDEDEESEDSEDESSEEDEDDDDSEGEREEDVEDDEVVVRRDPNAMTAEEEDEFSRELAKMMVTSGSDARKTVDRKALADLTVPFVRKNVPTSQMYDAEPSDDMPSSGMKFTLLTKKGTKQQTTTMEIPLEAPIAVQTMQRKAQSKAEQMQLKQLVLDYERREEQNEKQALKDTMARRGINLRYANDKNR